MDWNRIIIYKLRFPVGHIIGCYGEIGAIYARKRTFPAYFKRSKCISFRSVSACCNLNSGIFDFLLLTGELSRVAQALPRYRIHLSFPFSHR